MNAEFLKPPKDPSMGITSFSDKHLLEARKWVGVQLLGEEIPGTCKMEGNCLIVDSIFLRWLSKRVPAVNELEYSPGFAKYLSEKYSPELKPGESIWVQSKFDANEAGDISFSTENVSGAVAILHELPSTAEFENISL